MLVASDGPLLCAVTVKVTMSPTFGRVLSTFLVKVTSDTLLTVVVTVADFGPGVVLVSVVAVLVICIQLFVDDLTMPLT